MNLRFANEAAFYWLLLILTGLVAAFFIQRKQRQAQETFFAAEIYQQLTLSVDSIRSRWKSILWLFGMLFLVVGLARPQSGKSLEKVKSEGFELIFAVDVSESMMAEDLRPNRLEQTKRELSRLVDLMPGNKVGLIAFAGSAALLSPLTNDPAAIKMFIESLSPLSVSSQGTFFSDALKLAKEAFERGGISGDPTTKVTRAVLISSDGEDHEPGALEAAKELSSAGIKIFTVAFGTEKGGTIPVRDSMGFLKGYKKDESGQVVITTVKGDFLKKLADAGDGRFYFATAGGDQTQALVKDFDRLEKKEFDQSVAVQYQELFQIFLLIGFILLTLEIFLSQRRAVGALSWRGRYIKPEVKE